jgi:hypothetical protein
VENIGSRELNCLQVPLNVTQQLNSLLPVFRLKSNYDSTLLITSTTPCEAVIYEMSWVKMIIQKISYSGEKEIPFLQPPPKAGVATSASLILAANEL